MYVNKPIRPTGYDQTFPGHLAAGADDFTEGRRC